MTELLDTTFIPSSPDDRKKIKDAIIEASGLKQMQKDKGDQIKDIIDYVHSEYHIPKKLIRQTINTFWKQDYAEATRESAMFELFFENVVETQASP